MTLHKLKEGWIDTPEYHAEVKRNLTELTNSIPELRAHRNFIDDHIYGFGDRAFWGLWKLIMDELPQKPKLLEIGCFKGATLSVWQLLKPKSMVYGVTPLDSTGLDWEGDYEKFIQDIHTRFIQVQPTIIKGLSESKDAIARAQGFAPYDVVYIDGGHEKHHIDNDMLHYAPLVKQGGYLVVDDCCNDLHLEWGEFQGIDPVTEGVNEYIAIHTEGWEFVCSVVHIKVFKRK